MSKLLIEDDSYLVDRLAALEHERWSKWMRYLFSRCSTREGVGLIIPESEALRWARQMSTTYDRLSPTEKASDRIEADNTVKLLRSLDDSPIEDNDESEE